MRSLKLQKIKNLTSSKCEQAAESGFDPGPAVASAPSRALRQRPDEPGPALPGAWRPANAGAEALAGVVSGADRPGRRGEADEDLGNEATFSETSLLPGGRQSQGHRSAAPRSLATVAG